MLIEYFSVTSFIITDDSVLTVPAPYLSYIVIQYIWNLVSVLNMMRTVELVEFLKVSMRIQKDSKDSLMYSND